MNSYVEEVRVYNIKEQVKHRGFLLDKILYTHEKCNTDQISNKEIKDLGSDMVRTIQLTPCQICLKANN